MSDALKFRKFKVSLIVSFLVFVVLGGSGCSHPRIQVSDRTPVSFKLSGSETIQFFQIATADSVIWRVGPTEDLSLNKLGRIEYGQIPRSCLQTVPKVEPAPLLRDGIEYSATAVIFDEGPVVVRFTISNGTVQSR
jgi:hypothetical protein